MQFVQLIRLVAVISCLWGNLESFAQAEQLRLIAKQENGCQLKNLTAGELLSISDPPTKLSTIHSISISCPGNATGNLKLTFHPSVVYNGEATMQFISGSGVLAGANSFPAANTMTIPISSSGDLTGNGLIRVSIIAPPGKLLRAAINYKLVLDATIIP
jgi:hypothetical protein